MFDFAKKKYCANRLANIMKGIAAVAPTLLLTLMLTSCMSDGYTDTTAGQSETYINLNVSTPTAQARANASASAPASTSESLGQDETAPSPEEEEKIYSIRVWAFNSDNTDKSAKPIGFKSETGLNETGSHRVSMKLLRKTAEGLKNIDLYILLNAESIGVLNGSNLNTLTRGDLESATFDSPFGINEDGTAQTAAVPSEGLPISRIITNISIDGHIAESETQAAANPVSVPLVRAVSKLHFFFARKNNKDTEGVEITKIEVDENMIASSSPVFPTAATEANKATEGLTGNLGNLSYLSQKLTFGGVATDDINTVDDPKSYARKDGEAAQDYMTRLRAAVKESHRAYLRETGKEKLTGKIWFKSNKSGTESSATFEIPEAHRNHELVVYGYFLGDSETDLTLQYYVANWNDKGNTNIKFD